MPAGTEHPAEASIQKMGKGDPSLLDSRVRGNPAMDRPITVEGLTTAYIVMLMANLLC